MEDGECEIEDEEFYAVEETPRELLDDDEYPILCEDFGGQIRLVDEGLHRAVLDVIDFDELDGEGSRKTPNDSNK